ncbi:MAG TPA: hypothetical protein VEP90_28865, partial [Methylomirabilota bacterium]|nr:hypothetical protein [Methylomirabilota bacterium]
LKSAARADAELKNLLAKADTEFKNLLADVMWPREITRGSRTFEVASKLSRQREVFPDSEGKSGTFFSQKMGRQVQSEINSRLHGVTS